MVRPPTDPGDERAVLLTMGGTEERCAFLEQLAAFKGATFIVPGGVAADELDEDTDFDDLRSSLGSFQSIQ